MSKSRVDLNLNELYAQLVELFYQQGDHKQSLKVAQQLDDALAMQPGFAESIRGDEVRSLIAELRGDLSTAILSRQSEIRKILELYSMTQGTPGWSYAFRKYNYQDVSDRLDILATLHAQSGNYQEASKVLLESKSFCSSHRIQFDGDDLIKEYAAILSDELRVASDSSIHGVALDRAIVAAYKELNISVDQILIDDQKCRQFVATVARLAPVGIHVTTKFVKSRLLNLSKRGEQRSGLPRLQRRA